MLEFYLVGITGGSGSGKSTACRLLSSLGYPVIDADKVGHEINAFEECRMAFGDESVDLTTGKINRPYFRERIVKNPLVVKKLQDIMMPKIRAKIDEIIVGYKQEGRPLAFLDAPLLFEFGFNKYCNFTVTVTADRETRIKRVMDRDKQTRENTTKLFNLQMSDRKKIEQSNWIITNKHDLNYLYQKTFDMLHHVHYNLLRGK